MTILIDCDGVLADFVGAVLQVANPHLDTSFTREDVTSWNLFDLWTHNSPIVQSLVSVPGFCSDIKPISEAREGLQALRELDRVVCVTSPWHSPTWCHERTEWLKSHMGFSSKDIIFAADKSLVSGWLMIDDHEKNLGHHAHSVLMDQPYNQGSGEFTRCHTLLDVVSWAK